MMSITHAAIALSRTSLILGTASPLSLGLAILGSQLADVNTTTSTIGEIFYPISSWIEDRFPHRSITHSWLATAGITAVGLAVNYFFLHGNIKAAIALPLGRLKCLF
ncbi:metal-dependent hydrolase [Pleurocapsa sp. FMAR1]|uniref:metal-dependent hydrolase n=1 Tax=Pleurocapsa sp. FMAR1 TaxID=3040204 RepID=UPI0029C94DCA|nr:metal-dependent hydrolase [Pleurocapsa sp. FMAR1]